MRKKLCDMKENLKSEGSCMLDTEIKKQKLIHQCENNCDNLLL